MVGSKTRYGLVTGKRLMRLESRPNQDTRTRFCFPRLRLELQLFGSKLLSFTVSIEGLAIFLKWEFCELYVYVLYAWESKRFLHKLLILLIGQGDNLSESVRNIEIMFCVKWPSDKSNISYFSKGSVWFWYSKGSTTFST